MSVFLKFAAAAAGLVVFAVLALVALTPRAHKVEIVAGLLPTSNSHP